MSNKKQTAVDLIDKKIDIYLNWVETKQMSFKEFHEKWDELKNKAKELEKQQEYETKCFWYGRGVLAHKENKIKELKPILNNYEQ